MKRVTFFLQKHYFGREKRIIERHIGKKKANV